MHCVKAGFQEAQKTKEFLSSKDYLDRDHKITKTSAGVLFPVRKEALKALKSQKISILEKKLEKMDKQEKEDLSKFFTKKEIEEFPSSFDMIGETIIIEIPEILEKKEEKIAEIFLKNNKKTKTVLKKAGVFEGEFRTRKLKFLAGINTKEAVYRENNVMIKLNLEKVYFSSRLSTERKRIAQQVKAGEEILVMFSGCAPYPLVLAKNTDAKMIYSVEINPAAHKYAEENVKLNKAPNIRLFNGDVKEIVPEINKKFDRILMPLPKSAEDFLDIAFLEAKKGTIIHFYDFQREDKIPEATIEKIDKACRRNKLKYRILNVVKCGQYAPREFRVCVDFQML